MEIGFVIGIVSGILLAYLYWRDKIAKGRTYDALKEDFFNVQSHYAASQQLIQDYQKQIETLDVHLKEQFKIISSDLFKENATNFFKIAESGIEKYNQASQIALQTQQTLLEKSLEPFKQDLAWLHNKMEVLEKVRLQSDTTLKEQLQHLSQLQINLENQTQTLSRALCDPNTRGRWGELQLKRVVEAAGMLEYVDFELQKNIHEGILRPDMVVHLPNDRLIIVDAKSPKFDDYILAFQEANDQNKADQVLLNCCKRIRDLILKLGQKSYGAYLENAADFVVLFFPGEWIFSHALSLDKTLIEYASQHNVVFATPTTLIALLKAVHYGWRQNKMVQEVHEIGRLGGELYERIEVVSRYFQDLRKNLNNTVLSYNQLIASMESRVIPSAKRLHVFSKKQGTLNFPSTLEPLNQDKEESLDK